MRGEGGEGQEGQLDRASEGGGWTLPLTLKEAGSHCGLLSRGVTHDLFKKNSY